MDSVNLTGDNYRWAPQSSHLTVRLTIFQVIEQLNLPLNEGIALHALRLTWSFKANIVKRDLSTGHWTQDRGQSGLF